DATGAVQDTITYDPYGGILTESNNSVGDRNKWAGYDFDSYAGVYWVHIRWYDPVIAVWITPDPLGLAPDINPTRYVHNMPTNATDPSGLEERAPSDLYDKSRGKMTLEDLARLQDLDRRLDEVPPSISLGSKNCLAPSDDRGFRLVQPPRRKFSAD